MALSGSLNFITASLTGSANIKVDFVGLNTLINEPITASSNTLGYPAGPATTIYFNSAIESMAGTQPNQINSLLLHRNGPYQHPSWKQISGDDHPVARHLRLHNTMSIEINNPRPTDANSIYKFKDNRANFDRLIGEEKQRVLLEEDIYQLGLLGAKVKYNNATLRHYYEPSLITKYKPFRYSINTNDGRELVGVQAMTNQMHFFTNDDLNAGLNLSSGNPLTGTVKNYFDKRKQQYYKLFHSAKSAGAFNFIYSERLFPREINAYRAFKLQRPNFEEVAGTGSNGYDRTWGEQRLFWKSNQSKEGGPVRDAVSDGTSRLRTNNVAKNSLGLLQDVNYKKPGGPRRTVTEILAQDAADNDGQLSKILFNPNNPASFNARLRYAVNGFVFNQQNNLTGASTAPIGISDTRTGDRAFVQHLEFQPNEISLLSAWPLDPRQDIYDQSISYLTSSIGGRGKMLGLTPHTARENGILNPGVDYFLPTISASAPVAYATTFGFILTGTAGELAYSTKPTIFFYANDTGGGGGIPTFTAPSGPARNFIDGYIFPLASAQYHRHAHPYNSPFYATDKIRGQQPNYDTYSDFSSLIKESGRDHSIVPEFNITEHLDNYTEKLNLNSNLDKNVFSTRTKSATNIDERKRILFLPKNITFDPSKSRTKLNFLTLEGADITSSAEIEGFTTITGAVLFTPLGPLFEYDDMEGFKTIKSNHGYHHKRLTGSVKFNQKYSHTDTLDNFSHLMQQKEGFADNQDTIPSEIIIRCHAVKKARVKNGFYPVARTLQISKDFNDAFFDASKMSNESIPRSFLRLPNNDNNVTSSLAKQTLIEPLFAPGLLYNSIKSGIAVDWPIYKDLDHRVRTFDDLSAPILPGVRMPMYYAPLTFISSSGGTGHTGATGRPHTDERVNSTASSSFNYGGFQMMGSSRCIPAILNNTPTTRLPFRALYDFAELDKIYTTDPIYLPTDFIDLDRAFITQNGAGPLFTPGLFSRPQSANSHHPGYAIPGRETDTMLNHPGALIPNEGYFTGELQGNNPRAYRYFSSINNYLSETMRFFLADVEASDVSIPGLKLPVVLPEGLENESDSENLTVKDLEIEKPYLMSVKLTMGSRQVMCEGPRRAGIPRNSDNPYAGATMRGALYGPPIEVVPHSASAVGSTFYPYGLDTIGAAGIDFTGSNPPDLRVRTHTGTDAHQSDFDSYFMFNLQDPAYQAYTPPYFYGDSSFVFRYVPDNAGDASFREVWEETKTKNSFYYEQYDTGTGSFGNLTGNDANALCLFLPATSSVSSGSLTRMKIDASLEFSDAFDVARIGVPSDKFSSAYVAPWWVCPVLDFSSSYAAVYTGSTNDLIANQGDEFLGENTKFYSSIQNIYHDITTGKGMWGGYGTDPYNLDALKVVAAADPAISSDALNSEKGIYISISDDLSSRRKAPAAASSIGSADAPPTSDINGFFIEADSTGKAVIEQTGSLSEKLGFSDAKIPIGRIANRKNVSEAIVIIPYLENKVRIASSSQSSFKSGFPLHATDSELISQSERGGFEISDVFYSSDESGVTDIVWGEGSAVVPGGELYTTREIIPGKHFLPIHKTLFENVLSMLAAKKYVKPDAIQNYHGLSSNADGEIQNVLKTDVGKMIANLIGYDSSGQILSGLTNTGYQLPPELDFIYNSSVEPFQMIVVPFNQSLDNQDLIDIYQGVPPEIARKIEKDIQEIVLKTSGISNLDEATWMPSIPLESTSYRRDLEFINELNNIIQAHMQANPGSPFAFNSLDTFKEQAAAAVAGNVYNLDSVPLDNIGLESFLVSPYSIINSEKMQDYINLGYSVGLEHIATSRDFYSKLKFMVFKVKQRGIKNYKQYRSKQISGAIRKKYEDSSGYSRKVKQTEVLDNVKYSEVYGSNWPYDFLSLIETIKIDIDIKVDS